MVETHTYFTELPLELVRTGTGELGPPPLPGAGATVLAGIWPAHRNHCEHREWVQEDSLGGVAPPAAIHTEQGWAPQVACSDSLESSVAFIRVYDSETRPDIFSGRHCSRVMVGESGL